MNVERELMKAAVPTDVETEDERLKRAIDEPMLRLRVLHERIAMLEALAFDRADHTHELPDDESQANMRWRFHTHDMMLTGRDSDYEPLDVAVRIRTPEELLAYAWAERDDA